MIKINKFWTWKSLIGATIIIGGAYAATNLNIGGDAVTSEDITKATAEVSKLDAEQESFLSKNSKYQRVNEYCKEELCYQVTEYVTPKGEVGKQTIIKKGNYVKSIGEGPESKERTWDWTEFVDPTKK